MEYKISDFKSGQGFKAIIDGVRCEGKVQVEYDDIYLCQNEKDGNSCVHKLGYQYSWVITDLYTHELKMLGTTDLVLFNDHTVVIPTITDNGSFKCGFSQPSERLEIKTDGKEAKMVDCRIDGVQGFQINQPTQYGIAIDDLFSIKTCPTYEVKLYGKVVSSDDLRDFFKQHDPRIAELRKELAELEARAEEIKNTLKERN
jgi:hypothetical protein